MSCSTQGISNAYVLQMRQPVQSTATVPIPQHSTTTTASIATPPATTNTPTPAITNEPATTATSFPSNTPLNLANNQSLLSRLNVDAGGGSRILLQQGPDDTAEYERNNNISDILFSGQWWKHVVAGALAGTISRTCTAPLDRTKVMLQVKGAQFTSIRACFKHMVSEGGKKSLWRGNGINVLKIGPESSIRFLVYEQVKVAIKSDSDEELGIKWRMLAGSIAGSVAQSVIYPLEVLKTRMCLRQTGQYKGLRDAWKQILRNEGIKAFYRGYWANLCGIIPYAGIDLAVYEVSVNLSPPSQLTNLFLSPFFAFTDTKKPLGGNLCR